MRCRHCGKPVDLILMDLGSSPPSNSYLANDDPQSSETFLPLRVLVCESCWLVQTEDFADASLLFGADYAYFSGYSSTWTNHCQTFTDEVTERFGLDGSSRVVEVACNDGTLLNYFQMLGMRCTGIEPTASTAAAALDLGLDIREVFLDNEVAGSLAADGVIADLLVANNVLAHVPDIVSFTAGCRRLLASSGVASFEFHHLVELVSKTLFDTIYHEHFSYLSLTSAEAVFSAAGLKVFDVEQLATHGGSLRVYAQRVESDRFAISDSVQRLRDHEESVGVTSPSFYTGFQERSDRIKDDLMGFLLHAKNSGQSVAGYGAAAKGNTLLNYAGVHTGLMAYVVDNNPAKQGKFLPGSRIPIVDEQRIVDDPPDFVLILPWNIREEIARRLESLDGWSGAVVTALPELQVD
ncbi:MAG: class I SAM-dependent methyltransferase [Acidimicrobiales bacterium]|nr:class I SAM-dependent methyltransferase [Acidimicrobiales bacterium]